MAVLSMYLSPFAPDYSGVASVLFDLNTVTAMHDASGCTGNYTGYDEPRWYGSKSPIFCSGLREIDAVLGDDEKLLKKMMIAAEDLKPDLMALVGSPVPMVIGTDLVGIAAELEERTRIPSLGFDTTGTFYYDKGVSMATIALLKKFTSRAETVDGSVNIVGASPLDFSLGENVEDLKSFIEQKGYQVRASLSMGYNMEQLKRASSAQVNLAVSRAGLLIAKYMYDTYDIPYVCGMPVGEKASGIFLDAVRRAAAGEKNQILKGNACKEPEILIIGEQIQSNAVRMALETEFGKKNVAVGCLFGKEEVLSLPQDINLANERLIKEEINKAEYKMIIADPFMRQLIKKDRTVVFCSNPQYAVSSKIHVNDTVRIIGQNFNKWIEQEGKYKSETNY